MPIVIAAELPVSTKDPRQAVGQTIALIETHATTLDGLKIDLSLFCMARREVALRLAERLPSKALGFRNILLSDRALSAEQFQTQIAKGPCCFDGGLTEHLLPSDAFALIKQLLQSPPQAIRSTAFNLNIKNIHWKGSPAGGTGTVHLFDFKAFKRAGRFSLSATLRLPCDDAKSPEVRDSVRRVGEETGFPFNIRTASRVLGEEAKSHAHAHRVLVGQICFDEVIESVADELPKNLISEFAPGALSPDDARGQRFQQWGAGRKVNLPSLLKRGVKEGLPEFKFRGSNPDQLLFAKRIAQDSELLVIFQKAMPRIGKAFTLAVGLGNSAEQVRFTANLFQLQRTTEQKTWIYTEKPEADDAVKEAVNLLKEVLPRLECAVTRYFERWPGEFPAGIEHHGPLTARGAFAKAEPLAQRLFSDAVLIRLGNHARSLTVRDIEGPELSLDGRLIQNAMWWFHFYSAGSDTSFEVMVPALGRIRVLDHGKQYQNTNARYILVPAGTNWMDSDRAFALAEERGGQDRRNSGKTFGLISKMQMSRSQEAYWGFMYLVVDERGRNDLIVNMDAITGEPIPDIRGF